MLKVLLLNMAHCSPLRPQTLNLLDDEKNYCKNAYRKSGVPGGHSFVAQLRTRTRFPVQYFPPFDGGGSVQSLKLFFTPPPHVLVHSPKLIVYGIKLTKTLSKENFS